MSSVIESAIWIQLLGGALACLTLVSLGLAIWTVRSAKIRKLQLTTLLELRDLSVKNSILIRLPEHDRIKIMKIIDEAFTEGAQMWSHDYLEALYGREEASKIIHTHFGALVKD